MFAPQSVVMPVGALTLVLNIAIAHFMMGEKLEKNDIIATFFIVVGAVNVAVSYGVLGENGTQDYSLDDLLLMYRTWSMFIYMLGVAGVVLSLFAILRRCEKTAEIPMEAGAAAPSHRLRSILRRWHPVCYAGMSGIFGSCSVIMAASTMQLLKTTFKGTNQFKRVETYLILIAMIAFIMMQTHFLALGLKYFDSLFIVPVFQCFFIIFSIFGGAIYFRELDSFTVPQWVLFLLAVGVTLGGILLMSSREMEVFSHDDRAPRTPEITDCAHHSAASGASDQGRGSPGSERSSMRNSMPYPHRRSNNFGRRNFAAPYGGVGFMTLQTR
jgi:hypothetical protein